MINGGSIADFQCLGNSVKDQKFTMVSEVLQNIDMTIMLWLGTEVVGLDTEIGHFIAWNNGIKTKS